MNNIMLLTDSYKLTKEKNFEIPTKRFGEDELTNYAFGKSAKEYGEFLKEAGIKEMPIYLANIGTAPFARQAWLHGLDSGDWSGLLGDISSLNFDDAVRGVRNVEPRSGEDRPKISAPNHTEVLKYSRQFVPEVARKDFEKGLEALFREQ